MKVIGLTGGIGSGKSTVSDYFRNRGFIIIDADKIAHEITEKGHPVLKKIAFALGPEIINEDGSMNRKKVSEIVFSDSKKLEMLNRITHKAVIDITVQRLNKLKEEGYDGAVILDVPLLFESGMDKLADEIWVVHVPRNIRIERVAARDGLERDAIIKRIDAQMSDEERLARADVVIDNSRSLEELNAELVILAEKNL